MLFASLFSPPNKNTQFYHWFYEDVLLNGALAFLFKKNQNRYLRRKITVFKLSSLLFALHTAYELGDMDILDLTSDLLNKGSHRGNASALHFRDGNQVNGRKLSVWTRGWGA